MFRFALILCLVTFVLFPYPGLAGEEKHLQAEEVLRLKNLELTLQNLTLQAELITRDLQRVRQERDTCVQEFYQRYGLEKEWKIDLEKGLWFKPSQSAETAGR
jgi:hypothetical protein